MTNTLTYKDKINKNRYVSSCFRCNKCKELVCYYINEMGIKYIINIEHYDYKKLMYKAIAFNGMYNNSSPMHKCNEVKTK